MTEAALARAADHFTDAERFVREAQLEFERGNAEESIKFAAAARKAAEDGAFELRAAT